MNPEALKFLFDIHHAIQLIEDFTKGLTFTDYQKDFKTKSAVERQLGIIGEAVNKYGKLESPELKNSKQIVAFRNRIIHAYDSVDDVIVWAILKRHLPGLKKETIEFLRIHDV
jgi:uncharacterized protein with HEPN domain